MSNAHLSSIAGSGFVAVLFGASWLALAEEEQLSIDQVPAAARTTILQEAAGGRITEIERQTRGGLTVYEAEFRLNGDDIEIEVAADGTLLGRELERHEPRVSIEQFPEAARAALTHHAGGSRIIAVEQDAEGNTMIFEAMWITNDRQREAAVTADGTLVELEERIELEDAPQVVRMAAAEHFPAGVLLTVEKKMVVIYEIEARIGGREQELMVFPSGRVQQCEDDDEDADDDDDDDDDDKHDVDDGDGE